MASDIQDMMAKDPQIWQRRPLPSQLLQYAAADVSHLLTLAEILSAKLGEVGQAAVFAISQIYSQQKLDASFELGAQARLNLAATVPVICFAQLHAAMQCKDANCSCITSVVQQSGD